MQAGRSSGGSVLILVLWTLFILASLAVALGARVGALVRAASFARDRMEARAQAVGAVAVAQAQAMAQTNEWDGPVPDCWTSDRDLFGGGESPLDDPKAYRVYHLNYDEDGGAHTNAGLLGVEARININHADVAVLEQAFRLIGGMQAGGAAAVAREIVAARTGENDANARRPEKEEEGAGGAFASLWALQEMKGMDETVWVRISRYLTTWGSGSVNLNAASRPVLECLFMAASGEKPQERMVETLVDRILEVRADGRLLEGKSVSDWLTILRESGDLPAGASGLLNRAAKWVDVGSTCWEGVAEGRSSGPDPYRVHVDFVVDGEAGSVVHWREW